MKGLTILVADDQPGVRRLLHEVFRAQGYRVILARDGCEAIAAATKTRPAAVLLDLRMPGKGGLEALEELKQLYPEVPVVLMTAVNEIDVEEALTRGADRTISKPFDIKELQQVVAEVVSDGAVATDGTGGLRREGG